MKNLEEPEVHPGYVGFGAAVIAVGVLFLTDSLDLLPAFRLSTYWPALLIGFGLVRIIWPVRSGSEIGGTWLTLVGGLLLLDRMAIAPMRETWPVLVIMAGLLVVFRAVGWLPASRCHVRGRRWEDGSLYSEARR
jgi:hypothetical protein